MSRIAISEHLSLFYTDEGVGGPPMLFVHGYSCDSHDWSWQLPYFVTGHRVIAADNRGHGRSSVVDSGYDHDDFAADLAVLLDDLSPGPVVAIGHSLGGVIVSTLAIERPDLVAAVVAIDPGYLVSGPLAGQFGPVIEALQGPDPIPASQALLRERYGPDAPPALRTWHMRRIEGTPVNVLRETLVKSLSGMSLASVSAPYLARRQCPVLAMHTDHERAAVEAALFTHVASRVATFDNTGHWIHQERPDEVNRLIEDWLQTIA